MPTFKLPLCGFLCAKNMEQGLYQHTEEVEAEITPVIQTLGHKLEAKFEEWAAARHRTEEEWLKDLRAFNSQYDPGVSFHDKRSKVFVSITRTKTMAAYSRIVDMLFSSSLKPYGCKPTPIPDVPSREEEEMAYESAKQQFIGGYQQKKQEIIEGARAGQVQDPQAAFDQLNSQFKLMAKQAIDDFIAQKMENDKIAAREAAKKMEEQITDQLVEAGFEKDVKRSIQEMCILGTGALKGASMKIDRKQAWDQSGNNWEIRIDEMPKPDVQHISVFDIYPDPYSTDLNDFSGLFHRRILTKSQLRALKSNPMFDSAAIDEILINNPDGNHTELHHEIERRQMSGIDAAGSSGRYEVLEYWGPTDGKELRDCGCDVDDETVEYQSDIWFCDGHVILGRLNPTPSERIPYELFPYERTPHQFWGVGPARMMRDSQTTVNAAARVMLDNLAITAGPQVEVNTSMIQEGEDPNDIYPFKVWLREGGDPNTPMLRFNQPTNNAAAMSGVINMFREHADEETSLPRYMHGEHTGATRTSSGLSMLMGAANMNIKSVIKNLDSYLFEPLIQSFYDWNMQWNPREEIKGDMKIVAQGSTSLVAKEIQAQSLIQFAQTTMNEVDAQHINRKWMVSEIAKSMELPVDKIIKEEEGPSEQQMQMQQMQMQAQQLEMAEKEAKVERLLADAYRARKDADTMDVLREAEARKDFAVAERAVASISQDQGEKVTAPPMPDWMKQKTPHQKKVATLPRDVATQAQYA